MSVRYSLFTTNRVRRGNLLAYRTNMLQIINSVLRLTRCSRVFFVGTLCSGPIPIELGNLTVLLKLDLSINKLIGETNV